jgi:predicted ribosome quality control (RQC) complex YloA/Tae2 family protein
MMEEFKWTNKNSKSEQQNYKSEDRGSRSERIIQTEMSHKKEKNDYYAECKKLGITPAKASKTLFIMFTRGKIELDKDILYEVLSKNE